ncbi:MAG: hypothetical protein HDQ88_06995 [Clostridia bacterium]|nr:hypothetical protein [Clostridia bacterium]
MKNANEKNTATAETTTFVEYLENDFSTEVEAIKQAYAQAAELNTEAKTRMARLERAAIRFALHNKSAGYVESVHSLYEALPNGKELAADFRRRIPALAGSIVETAKNGAYIVRPDWCIIQYAKVNKFGGAYVFAVSSANEDTYKEARALALVENDALPDLSLLSIKTQNYKPSKTAITEALEKTQAFLDALARKPEWLDGSQESDALAAAVSAISYYVGKEAKKAADTYAPQLSAAARRGQEAKTATEKKTNKTNKVT